MWNLLEFAVVRGLRGKECNILDENQDVKLCMLICH